MRRNKLTLKEKRDRNTRLEKLKHNRMDNTTECSYTRINRLLRFYSPRGNKNKTPQREGFLLRRRIKRLSAEEIQRRIKQIKKARENTSPKINIKKKIKEKKTSIFDRFVNKVFKKNKEFKHEKKI